MSSQGRLKNKTMMALPFLLCFAGLWLAWRGNRMAAIAATMLAVLLVAVLYRLHATDALQISL